MCGPVVPWDWLMLDMAYVLVLLGGSLVLRARFAGIATWLSFGVLSAAVGAFLMHATTAANADYLAGAAAASPLAMMAGGC
jgi:hypothetical protein